MRIFCVSENAVPVAVVLLNSFRINTDDICSWSAYRFVQILNGTFRDFVTGLARSAASDMKFDNGRLEVKGDFSLQRLHQIKHCSGLIFRATLSPQGRNVISFPFSTNKISQIETDERRVKFTWPVIGIESDQIIGYVRGQAPEDLDKIIRALNLGLSGGIVMALVLSAAGGILLTRQAMQPVEQGFQRLKQFTADASHELRGPLMAIKQCSSRLEISRGMRATDAEKFKAIASAATQMTQLTEDLLPGSH